MSRDGGSRPNPWQQKRGGGPKETSKKSNGNSRMDSRKTRKDEHTNASSGSNTQQRFLEAKAKMEESVKKHMIQDYESSDEEEELQINTILGSVLQSYSALGGAKVDLGRTQHFLEDVFQSGAATCLICIGSVKRVDPVWSCEACYCFLHLSCTQRWAKDSLLHQKHSLEELPRDKRPRDVTWPCPKCRKEYEEILVPQKYICFCGQKENPPHHPWLVPHSCGETCGRPLQPSCGHNCLLLCHPGPCPPCPKTVRVSCHCGKEAPKPQRCSNKLWSCGKQCGAVVACGSHRCTSACHPGLCAPCPKKSEQSCACGNLRENRPCSSPDWHCDKPCGKRLPCGHHSCERVCHSGRCGACPLSEGRTCPCGKRSYQLACTDEAPPCGDTCGITLNCGSHTCPERCHRDKCGTCLVVTVKRCRCGLHQKELPCAKEFLCETKCKRSKDCGRHPCNRKCCDSQCPPCEKQCGRTLPCGQHKCESACHRGPCYPCPLTASVRCNCGSTVVTVPCGRQRRTRPPKCSKLCLKPPDCHHNKRVNHVCHFGSCPPCAQMCNLTHSLCEHKCPKPCHSAVWVKREQQAPAGPWEVVAPQMECRALPCPPCEVPVSVVCLGGHDSFSMPCHCAKVLSCGKKCDRPLKCTNHFCSLECHAILNENSCESCEMGCSLPKPEGCSHECPLPCHAAPCPPCRVTLRPRCHCGVAQLFVKCADWTKSESDHTAMTSCGNSCPKNLPCGHKCMSLCHPGDCPNAEKCSKKSKVYCPCRRIRKDIRCDVVRSSQNLVECDDTCQKLKVDKEKEMAEEMARKRSKEEATARMEAERYQKKLDGTSRRQKRGRQSFDAAVNEKHSVFFYVGVTGVVALVVALLFMFYT